MSDTITLTKAELRQIQAVMALVSKKLHVEEAGVSTPAPRKGRKASRADLNAAIDKHLRKYKKPA